MDGGIDLIYSIYFGWELQNRLQELIQAQFFGELAVGQAVLLATGHEQIPLLISAPTMRVPCNIANTINVYLAFRAALIAALEHNKSAEPANKIGSLLVPGFGTGVGQMPCAVAAKQMRAAYDAIVLGHGLQKKTVGQIWSTHYDLLS